jgi:hypothetical protein
VADATVSRLTDTALGAGLEVALAAGLEVALAAGLEMMEVSGLGTGVADRADAATVGRGADLAAAAVRGAEGRTADATPPEIRS